MLFKPFLFPTSGLSSRQVLLQRSLQVSNFWQRSAATYTEEKTPKHFVHLGVMAAIYLSKFASWSLPSGSSVWRKKYSANSYPCLASDSWETCFQSAEGAPAEERGLGRQRASGRSPSWKTSPSTATQRSVGQWRRPSPNHDAPDEQKNPFKAWRSINALAGRKKK
jgi:hypothetical protein